MTPASDFLTVTKDPIWPWSLPHVGLPALAAVGLGLIILTIWTYRGVPGVRSGRILAVLVLRLLALALVFLILLRPSMVFREVLRVPSILLVVIDRSESTTIQDEIGGQSRWSYMMEVLARCESILQQLAEEHNITTIKYCFAEDLSAYDADAKPDGKRTDFGQMLHSAYENHSRDQNLRGLVIISDGADNGMRYPALTEAARWRSSCPISTFGVGKPTTADRQRDIAFIGIVPEPSSVAIKGKLTLKGIIDAPGFEQSVVKVRLFINDKEVLVKDEELRKTFGNEVRLTTDAPATAGEIKVTLKVDPLPGELSKANNEISTFVTVTQEGISVLLVDRLRTPEPQRICDALSSDQRIRLYTAWLRADEPSADVKDLLQFDKQRYDVIILGDVSAARLTGGNADLLKKIRELVKDQRSGFLMMGGYDSFGNSDWKGTPIEDLLPVQLDASGQVDDLWRMEPTPAGLADYTMRLTDKPADNKVLWNKLPKMDGRSRLGKEKPGARVLAAVAGKPDEPVLVGQQYGKGGTLAFAGDTTWRWERLGQPKSFEGVELHSRFWKQLVLWLAWQDEAEGNVWVKPDSRRLPAGSKLPFAVGLRGKGGARVPDAHFDVKVRDPQGNETPVPTAREQDDERGTFWKTDLPGEYTLVVHGTGKDGDGQPLDGTASARFLIFQDDAEMIRRAADHEFLSKLANAGGDKFYKLDELPRFLKELQNVPLPQAKPKAEVWPDWRRTHLSGFRVGFFLAFVALLCMEWLLRRRWGMV